jgi:quinol monooxygenase YgiN
MKFIAALSLAGLIVLLCNTIYGQQKTPMVRLAKIVVDPNQIEEYKAILKEEAEESVRIEPGVLTLYAVQEKDNLTHFTILEIYADSAAYRSHLQTPHFIRYKTGTKDMVKSLELVETTPLIPDMKIKVDSAALKQKKERRY